MRLLKDILDEIKPTRKEQEKLDEVAGCLLREADRVASELETEIKPKLVGSAARGTWLSSERDIDIFLLFPESTDRESLEKLGLKIGKEIAGEKGREQYAEHPYINTRINGFDVDIVPCYDVADPSKIKSSVDRSPYHQDYVKSWLTPEKAEEVLLLKKFLKGIGVYGSDLKIKGFSGYLCELLIQYSGSFLNLMNDVRNWKERRVITLEDGRSEEKLEKAFPNHALIFIDPVDPTRNVAAAVSKKNYSIFVRACQDFIKSPSRKYFFPEDPSSSGGLLKDKIQERRTKIFLIVFQLSDGLVPDIVYPQLRKTERRILGELENLEIDVIRSSVWNKEDKAAILIETKFSTLPLVKEHLGPPIGIDAEPFIEKHLGSERRLSGPFMKKDGRMVFELKRDEIQIDKILRNIVESKEGFGSHIRKSIIKDNYGVFEGTGIVDKAEELSALEFLGKYLDKCLPWYR